MLYQCNVITNLIENLKKTIPEIISILAGYSFEQEYIHNKCIISFLLKRHQIKLLDLTDLKIYEKSRSETSLATKNVN